MSNYIRLSSQNAGEAIHLIMTALPREIMVDIHNGDEKAIDTAVYWLSKTDMVLTQTANGVRPIAKTSQVKFTRKQIIALVNMVFAILDIEE